MLARPLLHIPLVNSFQEIRDDQYFLLLGSVTRSFTYVLTHYAQSLTRQERKYPVYVAPPVSPSHTEIKTADSPRLNGICASPEHIDERKIQIPSNKHDVQMLPETVPVNGEIDPKEARRIARSTLGRIASLLTPRLQATTK